MRTNLVMQFFCSECGNILDMLYPSDEKVKSKMVYSRQENPELPTSGVCRHTDKIQIVPCRHCIEKHTKPAKMLADGIQGLIAASQPAKGGG